MPSYGNGERPAPEQMLGVLAGAHNFRLELRKLDQPCIVLPPLIGRGHLIVNLEMERGNRAYTTRHECGHIVMGDADEPALYEFSGPLPDCEMAADLYAFVDLVPRVYCEMGPDYVADFIRQTVRFDYLPWYHRCELERIPMQLISLRRHLDETGKGI